MKQILKELNSHECNLGKWYDGEGKRRFEYTSSYPKIAMPHEIVHKNANKNVHYLVSENPLDSVLGHSEEILRNFDTMEEASATLFSLMDNMLAESAK